MSRPIVSCICLLGLLTSVGCSGTPDTATPIATAERQEAVTFAEAVATASAEVPDGTPYEVELERLDGKDVIEVEFLVGAAVREVYIDPTTGDVLEVRDEPPDHTEQDDDELETQASMMSSSTISLADAVQTAADHTGGEVREVEFKVIDGKLVAEVEVSTGDGNTALLLDAATGEVIEDPADAEGQTPPAPAE